MIDSNKRRIIFFIGTFKLAANVLALGEVGD
jgi:hypothetical protein